MLTEVIAIGEAVLAMVAVGLYLVGRYFPKGR